jgi:hypothetical protein
VKICENPVMFLRVARGVRHQFDLRIDGRLTIILGVRKTYLVNDFNIKQA